MARGDSGYRHFDAAASLALVSAGHWFSGRLGVRFHDPGRQLSSKSSELDTMPVSSASITRMNPTTLLDSTALGLSQISIVEPGRLAYLSGQTATPRGGGDLPSRLGDQARIVADNLAAALKELEAFPVDVVLLRVYVVDATTDRFEEAWAPIRDMLSGVLPSMTGIGVQALWTPAVQLEVEMVVRLPSTALDHSI